MSGEELQVDPRDLHGKAAQIDALAWPSQAAQPPLISADALVIASVAVTNLRVNADGLWARQAYGQKEGERLAQTLRNVGDAYAQIDQMSGRTLAPRWAGQHRPVPVQRSIRNPWTSRHCRRLRRCRSPRAS